MPQESSPIIEVTNLERTFGELKAVQGISFNIFPGQVVGFIGANGAGKTTTMKMMVTLDLPSDGSIRICGYDTLAYPNEVRRSVGWMPDSFNTYENVSVEEYLDFYARAYGYRGKECRERVAEVMEFTDLTPLADRLMDKLSKGMTQRLCLGRTLLHDPSVLILDEPAAGLDPKARIELKNLIRLLAQEGKTLFISSHILSELGEMCNTMLFIDQGRLVHHGSSESLEQHDRGTGVLVDIQVNGPVAPLLEWIPLNAGLKLVNETLHGARVVFEDDDKELIAIQLKKMINDGIPVIDFHREKRKLEDAFVDILHKAAKQAPVQNQN